MEHGVRSKETNHPAIYPDESGTIYHLLYAQSSVTHAPCHLTFNIFFRAETN